MSLIMDEQYYFEDGNCVFRVDDHLFKIHQYLLTRESPFFENIFSLPQKSTTSGDGTENTEESCEGSSDDNPIVCQDSVTSFQAFCWGLYIRPTEVCAQEDPAKVDLGRLISLASVAHKYELLLLEKWAIIVLREHWMTVFNSSKAPSKSSWTSDIIGQFLTFSTKTDAIDQEFKEAIEFQWLSSINNVENPPNIQRVLDFADDFPSRSVRGLAYYRVLRRIGVFCLPGALDSIRDPDSKLGPDNFRNSYKISGVAEVSYPQPLKLMHGFWSLVSLRRANSLGRVQFECTCPSPKGPGSEDVRVTPPNRVEERFDHSMSHSDCRSAWDTIWMGLCGTLDFGAMLEEALRRLEGSTKASFEKPCKERLVGELRGLLVSFEDNLIDYFVLP